MLLRFLKLCPETLQKLREEQSKVLFIHADSTCTAVSLAFVSVACHMHNIAFCLHVPGMLSHTSRIGPNLPAWLGGNKLLFDARRGNVEPVNSGHDSAAVHTHDMRDEATSIPCFLSICMFALFN